MYETAIVISFLQMFRFEIIYSNRHQYVHNTYYILQKKLYKNTRLNDNDVKYIIGYVVVLLCTSIIQRLTYLISEISFDPEILHTSTYII